MTEHNGGPAFPTGEPHVEPGMYYQGPPPSQGMTLRDYFAGQALAGLAVETVRDSKITIAGACYTMADYMLAERAKEKETQGDG